jgi:hypothetical protein
MVNGGSWDTTLSRLGVKVGDGTIVGGVSEGVRFGA